MKKILLTETQLKKLTKSLLIENVIYKGNKITVNGDGTINVNNVKIRLTHSNNPIPLSGKGPWNINITKIWITNDGLRFDTIKRKNKEDNILSYDILDKLINYTKQRNDESLSLMSNMLVGDIKANKV
jgi:hypothetical protein